MKYRQPVLLLTVMAAAAAVWVAGCGGGGGGSVCGSCALTGTWAVVAYEGDSPPGPWYRLRLASGGTARDDEEGDGQWDSQGSWSTSGNVLTVQWQQQGDQGAETQHWQFRFKTTFVANDTVDLTRTEGGQTERATLWRVDSGDPRLVGRWLIQNVSPAPPSPLPELAVIALRSNGVGVDEIGNWFSWLATGAGHLYVVGPSEVWQWPPDQDRYIDFTYQFQTDDTLVLRGRLRWRDEPPTLYTITLQREQAG
ncbi:MAG: hypothetical protein H5T86_01275 [Armatimonadetes bacterium]|nr:hypothetical protein [Armatimonadota bacterium]